MKIILTDTLIQLNDDCFCSKDGSTLLIQTTPIHHSSSTLDGPDMTSLHPPLDHQYFTVYDCSKCYLLLAALLIGKINYHTFHNSFIKDDITYGISLYTKDPTAPKIIVHDDVLPFSNFTMIDDFLLTTKEALTLFETIYGSSFKQESIPFFINISKYHYDKNIERTKMREQQARAGTKMKLPGMM